MSSTCNGRAREEPARNAQAPAKVTERDSVITVTREHDLLELSDERGGQWLRHLDAYREGWDARGAALADQIGGRITPARPTDPRPGDYAGGPVEWDTAAARGAA